MLKGVPVKRRMSITPIIERGIVNNITNGCHRDSNCEAIIIKTNRIERISAI